MRLGPSQRPVRRCGCVDVWICILDVFESNYSLFTAHGRVVFVRMNVCNDCRCAHWARRLERTNVKVAPLDDTLAKKRNSHSKCCPFCLFPRALKARLIWSLIYFTRRGSPILYSIEMNDFRMLLSTISRLIVIATSESYIFPYLYFIN